ncbi:DPP IV N-terminal domain-containing protein [Gemmatimonas aurantiaca]|uniref:DPP IV N-terminal domain-containing protein n=1 Tax=Gemmatimonas aurantiaca TaxID=173480 RepID=UPI00301C3A22
MALAQRWTRLKARLSMVATRVGLSAIVATVAATSLAAPAAAQGYFGQNQVQYDRLRWRVIETEHFLVHYYPEIADVAPDAARMAERSYARLSRLMSHQFREKKPILIFGSSGDFAQSNVFGDLGEGTGGVTDPLRQRMAQFFSGDWGSFEHVLTHEMVHVFQFDIFSRGRAGAGLQNLAMVNPPLWFMEGLAEYLSIGPKHPWTDAWVRDAVINNALPSISQMTERPDKYFPYRYGLGLWQYVGSRWGDEAIGEIMNAVPSLGIDRAFRRELGVSLEELSNEWKQAMQAKYLPTVATLDRPRSFAEPLLTQNRTGSIANMFVAPALSSDGKYITYIGYGSLLRGEVFPEMYLADATTGKRITRLVKTTTNPDFEQLRFIYSQPSFSPDGQMLAFTGQRGGRDVLYLMDMRSRKVVKRIDLELDQVLSPSFSPDGRKVVFSGMRHGSSDLYVVSLDAPGYTQLMKDQYGDLMPQWSPDGKTIAFISDRGPDTDLEILKIGAWKVVLYDVETQQMTILPNQGGRATNPQWAPDGKSIAYVTDRTGIANIFLYDLEAKEHYQLTNVVGAVTAVAEQSPSITWARNADMLAFVYYEKTDHAIWKIQNPRALKKAPYRDPVVVAQNVPGAAAPGGAAQPTATPTPTRPVDPTAHLQRATVRDTAASRQSYYRPSTGNVARVSSELPASTLSRLTDQVSVEALMDSFDFYLPDTTRFRDTRYKARLTPEYIAQPSIGYQQNGWGQGTYGGTTIVLSDLLGNRRLALSGAINGTLADAQAFVGYTSLGRRLQYTTGVMQQPMYLISNYYQTPAEEEGQFYQTQEMSRLVFRQVFAAGLYPLNRFTRFELGARFQNIDQQAVPYTRLVDYNYMQATYWERGDTRNVASANTVSPYVAWVTDNSMFGYTGPISGKRIRVEFEPTVGSWQYNEFLADARSYIPILFNYITFATRFTTSMAMGRDELRFPKWIGRPDFVRGYNREDIGYVSCSGLPSDDGSSCNAEELIGSRVAFANAELRFPIIRRYGNRTALLGGFPPIDGLFFYDAGVAWSKGQSLVFSAPDDYDFTKQRALLKSYGFGLRMNLFNIAIIRWDWAKPASRPGAKGFGTWFFGASY